MSTDPVDEVMSKVTANTNVKATKGKAADERVAKKLFNDKYYRSINIDLVKEEELAEKAREMVKKAEKKKKQDEEGAKKQEEYKAHLRGMRFRVD